mmetsp:Transcript_54663/g.118182  ORF Transcript_54663/g.118182 Transcript_54663/m.118182 type:complete len:271 (+) Transcript_54663:611-1423(+)
MVPGKGDLLMGRVVRKELSRKDPRHMRFVESASEEEGLAQCVHFSQLLYAIVADSLIFKLVLDAALILRYIQSTIIFPHILADTTLEADVVMCSMLNETGRRIRARRRGAIGGEWLQCPRSRVVIIRRLHLVKYFSRVCRRVAMFLKVLGHGAPLVPDTRLSEVVTEVEGPGGVRKSAAEERIPTGCAPGIVRVGSRESQAFSCQAIHVWRVCHGGIISAKVGPHVVQQEEQDILGIFGGSGFQEFLCSQFRMPSQGTLHRRGIGQFLRI